MTRPTIPTVTRDVSSEVLSKTLESKNNSFELFYFDLNTHGATTRALLAYADAKWKMIHPGVSTHLAHSFTCPFTIR